MKYFSYLLFFLIPCISCDNSYSSFDFRSFDNTPVEKLAKAVKSGRISEIERLVKVEKLPIDYLDADYGHSILMLAVIYNLNASVEKLLQLDANPNLRSVIKQGMDSSYITTPMFLATNSILKNEFL